MNTSHLHTAARDGFAKEASTYASGRPDYPAELAGWLTGSLQLGPGRSVADVGAGTGKFCKLLVKTGANVLAIEPVKEMREQAQAIAGVTALDGQAQQMPVADASLDAIVCAQAFHWFAGTDTLDEFARTLKPGGRLGLVWNVRDESVDWVARITQIITPYEGDAPRFYKGDWRRPFPHPQFGALEQTSLPYQHAGPPAQVIIDRFMSVSFLAALPQGDRQVVRGQLLDLIATHPDLRGRETVSFPYQTLAFSCARL